MIYAGHDDAPRGRQEKEGVWPAGQSAGSATREAVLFIYTPRTRSAGLTLLEQAMADEIGEDFHARRWIDVPMLSPSKLAVP